MEFFKSVLGERAKQQESTSLLQEWNKYSSQQTDVEAGGSTSSQELFKPVETAGASLGGFLTSSFNKVSSTLGEVGASASSFQSPVSFPSGQQLVYSFCCFGAGVVLLLLAFTIALPVIILSPSKFALFFTMGCCAIMAGFAILKGWKQQLSHMLTKERLPFSVAYLGSVLSTLYSALVMHSYVFSLLCSGLQVVALVYYVASYFPGGAAGAQFILTLFYNAVLTCFGTVQRTLLK